MLRKVTSRVAWVGRTASMVFGLALVLALIVGVSSMAFGADGGNFILGENNAATALTRLTGNVNGSAMQVVNNNADPNDTALNLSVQSGEAPMRVNSAAKVTNLNSDKVDGQEASAFLGVNAKAADADNLDGNDSSELPGTVVQSKAISGDTSDVEDFNKLHFVTNPVTVTTTSTQQLVGVVSAPLMTDTSTVVMNYGLCYREAGTTNPLVLFYGGTDTVQAVVTTTTQSWTTAQTKVVGLAGTWDVGFCAANSSNNAAILQGDGKASGWIEVVNPTP
jgi:hypothetical protein